MQKQEDERKEKGPEKMDAVNEEYGYSPDIGDEYKQLIKEGDRRRKRTEKGRRKRYEQGYRNTLIKLMLTSGGIAYSGLKFLPGNKRMYLRKLKILEREGVVEILRRNKKEIARLVNFEENYEKYISHMPIGYYGYYLQHGKPTHKNLGSKEKNCTRSDRGIKHCEIYEMMYGTGIIKILPEDKTELSSTESLRSNSICYYTINEMRECQLFDFHINNEKDKRTIGSRAFGMLISPGGIYAVYNTGKAAMIWQKSSEGQMAYYMSQIVTKKCEGSRISGAVKNCIIIGYDMNVFENILNNGLAIYLNTDSGYDNMYAVPYTEDGFKMLLRMTQSEWEETLNEEILPDYERNKKGSIVYDGIKENVIALNFCTGNISRLKKFITGVQWVCNTQADRHYEIFCYSYQEESIRHVAPNPIEIHVVD